MIGVLDIEQAKDSFMPLDDSENHSKFHLREHVTQRFKSLGSRSEKLVESCVQEIFDRVH